MMLWWIRATPMRGSTLKVRVQNWSTGKSSQYMDRIGLFQDINRLHLTWQQFHASWKRNILSQKGSLMFSLALTKNKCPLQKIMIKRIFIILTFSCICNFTSSSIFLSSSICALNEGLELSFEHLGIKIIKFHCYGSNILGKFERFA